jgi:hypothetical protein
MSTSAAKKKRRRLWEADPHCTWCGTVTIWFENPSGRESLPNNAATLDHLYSRFDSRRESPRGGTKYTVLSCKRCNKGRNREQHLALPKAIRRQIIVAGGVTPEIMALIQRHIRGK